MKIGFSHLPPALGGPGTFQSLLQNELKRTAHSVCIQKEKTVPDVILVVGGTRHIAWLRRCKQQGARIVHRLDGLNWRHRIGPFRFRKMILAEIRNRLIRYTRDRLADYVVYQSKFSQAWWHREFGPEPCECKVIYNGTDLSRFIPPGRVPDDNENRLVVVEGNVQSDPASLSTLIGVSRELARKRIIKDTLVYGGIEPGLKAILNNEASITYYGKERRANMPCAFRSGTAFLCLEINPPCPNSVLEALASGLPVIGYDTGSLRELITEKAGRLAGYGSNPWLLEIPDLNALVQEAVEVFKYRKTYSEAARQIAEERYSHQKMTLNYLQVFDELIQ